MVPDGKISAAIWWHGGQRPGRGQEMWVLAAILCRVSDGESYLSVKKYSPEELWEGFKENLLHLRILLREACLMKVLLKLSFIFKFIIAKWWRAEPVKPDWVQIPLDTLLVTTRHLLQMQESSFCGQLVTKHSCGS